MKIPDGYDEHDAERLEESLDRAGNSSKSDARNPFEHDADRILYSPEFQILQGKTQVVASDQMGPFHNRLTHSLRVAQLGRRLTTLLGHRAREAGFELPTPSPDVVEAACLLHDIGHPPFGHIGEQEINAALDDLSRNRTKANCADGFQANAQNLRVVSQLAVRSQVGAGLGLTRATLDASIKYPWPRGGHGYGADHWGCYVSGEPAPVLSDAETLLWATGLTTVPGAPATRDGQPKRPIEEQIMDWCDEVTYACHDLEDFTRAGLIPLSDIFAGLPSGPDAESASSSAGEAWRFIEEHVVPKKGAEAVLPTIQYLQQIKSTVLGGERYRADALGRARLRETTSKLLNYFLGTEGTELRLEPVGADVATLTRYNANLWIDPQVRAACEVLVSLVRYYVIDAPSLATQQHGQRRMIRQVIGWLAKDPKRLLGPSRLEEFKAHQDPLRAAADSVWGMTEVEVLKLHRRLSGVDYGQLTD